MLMIENLADFEDFMEAEGDLDESIFGLYFSAGKGESLLIGGYEKDVTESVSLFLKEKLPETAFDCINSYQQPEPLPWRLCLHRFRYSAPFRRAVQPLYRNRQRAIPCVPAGFAGYARLARNKPCIRGVFPDMQ